MEPPPPKKHKMEERFDAAVTAMTLPENRFDVTIICTTDDHQAEFWMSKLDVSSSSGEQFPMAIAVSEDWNGSSGAGNGLGTLYAWKKAVQFAKDKFQIDLEALMLEGTISAALYHTAGKGTRMAPLPASENNNKPGVVSKTIGTDQTEPNRTEPNLFGIYLFLFFCFCFSCSHKRLLRFILLCVECACLCLLRNCRF